MRRLTLQLSAVAVFVLFPMVAFGAADIRFSTYGSSSDASFTSVDSSGCVTTSVFLQVSEELLHDAPGPQQTIDAAFVLVDQQNACTGEETVRIGFSSAGSYSADVNLAFADFNGAIDLCTDFSDPTTCTSNTLDVRWDGSVDLGRSHGATVTKVGSMQIVEQGVTSFRPATAVAILGDGVINYTPDPADIATINKALFHIVNITRGPTQ